MTFDRPAIDLGRNIVSPGKFLLRSIWVSGVVAFFAAHALSASAQALGDADCPGGYYFHPDYSLCVPLGNPYPPPDYSYSPPDYSYSPPIYMTPLYGQPYVFLGQPFDRDRRFAHGRMFDTDRR